MLHQVLQIFESWAHHIGPDDFSEFAKPCVPSPNPDELPVQSRSRGSTCSTLRVQGSGDTFRPACCTRTVGMRFMRLVFDYFSQGWGEDFSTKNWFGGLPCAAWHLVMNP